MFEIIIQDYISSDNAQYATSRSIFFLNVLLTLHLINM